MKPQFVIGIDLGTTHSAVAYSRVTGGPIESFAVPQLVAPGEVASLPLLPSSIYLPAEGELPFGATRLPWDEAPDAIVGEFAKRHGAKVPGRLVASAKSWLSHAGVDRSAPILPWGAAEGVPRLSPVEASARILAHVRAAWDAAHPHAPLASQEVILTLPASFDEVARELTVAAAGRAGLGRFRLLEEPQAAFYDFLSTNDASATLGTARLVLVVDVGGGTTDLTLIRAEPNEAGGPPRLERLAVGEHLVLGGDNMDAALARFVEHKLGSPLDAAQFTALVQASRLAKESLLAQTGPSSYGISVAGRGARLVGSARTETVEREEVEKLLLDGFLPFVTPDEQPARRGRVALTELGLPYASDPAITRHLSAFLRRHAQEAAQTGVPVVHGLPRPEAVLLNGGVFNASSITTRLSAVLERLFDGEAIPLLAHASLELAVARGAAYYGLVRRGFGQKIASGSARAYYVGLEADDGKKRAVCVVPRGMEEGTEAALSDRSFSLLLGKPVRFPLYSAIAQRGDALGAIVDVDDDLEPLPPLHTVLRSDAAPGTTAAVHLRAGLTELGTLELALQSSEPPERRFRLEFSLREGASTGGAATVAPIDELPRHFEEAREQVERCYGKKAQPVEAREIKSLWRGLERAIGERDAWSSAVNRELWGVVLGGAQKRRRSADHERVFFQLAGFCLRPGTGAPLDPWRIDELWKLFEQGVQYTTEKANWSEWWVMWRRVAGGLDAGRQRRLFEAMRPWLKPPEGRSPPKPKGPKAEGHEEMVRLVASLERLASKDKEEIGRWVFARLDASTGTRSYWPLGRIGARQLLFGSAHDVLAQEVAQAWLSRVLALDWKKVDGAAFAAAQLARRTGDRARDLSDEAREEVAGRLAGYGAPESWIGMVREVVDLSAQDEMRVFGDTLPAGLRLTGPHERLATAPS